MTADVAQTWSAQLEREKFFIADLHQEHNYISLALEQVCELHIDALPPLVCV